MIRHIHETFDSSTTVKWHKWWGYLIQLGKWTIFTSSFRKIFVFNLKLSMRCLISKTKYEHSLFEATLLKGEVTNLQLSENIWELICLICEWGQLNHTIYCKAAYFHESFNFANSRIFPTQWKLNAAKIKFLCYIHIKYKILAKLKPSQKYQSYAFAKFEIWRYIALPYWVKLVYCIWLAQKCFVTTEIWIYLCDVNCL